MKTNLKRQKAITDAETAILHSNTYPTTEETNYVTIEKKTVLALLDGIAELETEIAQLAQFVSKAVEGRFSQK